MSEYDIIIVGAGIAGSALAHALSTHPRPNAQPHRIALIERSLAEPDRIVGELLQPGGVLALEKLGLSHTLEGIDAIPVKGYCVVEASVGRSVHIPYPKGYEGRSFHHGRFVSTLRAAALKAQGVDVIEATVNELVEEGDKIVGVTATIKEGGGEEEKKTFRADLIIVADGCFSNFRSQVLGEETLKPRLKSHYVGAILEDTKLPIPQHGTVALVKGYGPVLLYQIGTKETRILVDLKATPLPADIKEHILTNIVPQLPSQLHTAIHTAFAKDRLRRMPNSFLPPIDQSKTTTKPGVILLGDAWNMRHPLTGGGMTVCLNDVVLLKEELGKIEDLTDWEEVKDALSVWFWKRKGLAATVNILSVALYDLFGADDEYLNVLRTGCFKYFERGGQCVNGPVSLLSGITPSPLLLFNHFFSVAFYAIWVMFTHPHEARRADGKVSLTRPSVDEYPMLALKAVRVFYTACVVFGPLLWTEVRWWVPQQQENITKTGFEIVLPMLLAFGAVGYGCTML
ncbi:squalene epoxidase-like protein [Cyathus striatus]|nr:squalene epoxidase-like protein [Cyathus striatus]